MFRLSAKQIKTLTTILLILSFQTLLASDWPVQTKIDLSSGFGDFRANRFHTGIDIRTGGRVGIKVVAPVSGHIHRIRTAYTGYGKGLYLKGDDGNIYVFGHLMDFEPRIDSLVKTAQRETRRYFLDTTLAKNKIKVKKGDLLGFSGQTGAGAPHLHFEKRTSNNLPLNPLTNGFTLDEKEKPIFTKIGFNMLDDYSLFDNGQRTLEFIPKFDSSTQNYYLDTLVYFNRPFGIFAGVFDQMKNNGMQQSVYKLTYNIDGKEFYQVIFEKLDFDNQRAVNFRYEYLKAVNKDKRVQRLYNAQGHDFDGSRSKNKSQGIINTKSMTYGHHKAEIIAEDSFGNKRKLLFDFIYGPEEELYKLDSHIVEKLTDHYFYFTPTIDLVPMQIDSIVPNLNRGKLWGKVKNSKVEKLENGQIRCQFISQKVSTTTIRLFLYSKKALIRDNIFTGVVKKGKLAVELNYEIMEDGILVNLNVRAKQSAEARIELYYKEKLIDVLYPQLFNMTNYACFIPPLKKYEHIDQIGFAMSKDTTYRLRYKDSLNIQLVGHKNNQKIEVENLIFTFEKDNFYKPRFIEIAKRFYLKDSGVRLVSEIVEIKPSAFLCKSNFKIQYTIRNTNPFYERTGFGWFNEEKKEWVWLENERDEYELTSESTGGGTFAVLYDLIAPTISKLNLIDQKTYYINRFKVTFKIEDDLSGIADDLSFNVKIDKEWLIPEYDPETNKFIATPAQPLSAGKHHFGLEVVDKVGNKTEQYLNFIVKENKRSTINTRRKRN